MTVLCLAAVLAPASLAAVKIWEEPLPIPTYVTGPPDPNPMFYFGRVYQGARGEVYPYPLYDKLTGRRENRTYRAVYLENEYLKICVLPELGGRIFSAVDKTNGYDFFYRQHVIKPALIGMLGAWISGGVEWNYPHHHRASSLLPVEHRLVENPDGSKTVWVGELELRHRMRWAIGLTLRPGKSYIETTVRLMNRTPFVNSFLYFANVAVHTNDDYQIIFPPSTQFVTQHAKREFARWPVADSVYGGTDFRSGVDVSWWKNHPNSISMFAWNYEDDFLAGYDHGRKAGTLHVADHNVVPGKKFWTWGAGPTGKMWDRILSDEDGPYVELMVGGYSDNQPDYSWAQPFETKSFQQFWYPFRDIGGVKEANLEAAVNLEVDGSTAKVGFCTTSEYKGLTATLKAGDKILFRRTADIGPGTPLVASVSLPPGTNEHDLRASLSAGEHELVAYAPVKLNREPMPEPVRPPPPPKDIKTNEELYLAGLRLTQFHSPAMDPDPYYEEALRRDPGDARVNTALATLYLKRGMYPGAEKHLRAAIARLAKNYTSPKDGEAYYYLGMACKAQGKLDAAHDAFYKATWSSAWKAASYFALAEVAGLRGDFPGALAFLDRSLAVNGLNPRALNLKAAILKRLQRPAEAREAEQAAAEIDPLAAPSRFSSYAVELAVDYGNAGLWKEAVEVLSAIALPSPMAQYYLGYYLEKLGERDRAARAFRDAAAMPPDYVFPFQLEAMDALGRAMEVNPRDARAPYYLGNLFYDRQPDQAIALWEKARSLDPVFPIVHRNLALAYARQQDGLDKAIASLEKAVSLNGDDPMFLFELDQMYEAAGAAPEKRLALLDRHHDTVLKRDDTLSRQIALLVGAGRYARAIELLKSRTFHIWEGGARFGAHESWVDAHVLRGRERFAAGNFKDALADYQAALEYPENLQTARPRRGGRNPEVLYWIGTALEALGQAAKARESWNDSAAQYERGEETSDLTAGVQLYYRARSLEKLGDREKAAGIYRHLISAGSQALQRSSSVDYFAKFGERQSHRSRMAQAHYVAGLGELGLGGASNAAGHFRRAVEQAPDHLGARTALAAAP